MLFCQVYTPSLLKFKSFIFKKYTNLYIIKLHKGESYGALFLFIKVMEYRLDFMT
jgi:hypothetical protein